MVTDQEVRCDIGTDRLNHAAGHSVQVWSHKGCHRVPSGLTYRILLGLMDADRPGGQVWLWSLQAKPCSWAQHAGSVTQGVS